MKQPATIFFFCFFLLLSIALANSGGENLFNFEKGPVSLFEDKCAGCHGPEGKFYGEGFAEPKYNTLRQVVLEMMEGPAFLKPKPYEVNAMTAYHRALAAGEPFGLVTNGKDFLTGKDQKLRGEASPGSEVLIEKEDETCRSPVKDMKWIIESPPQPPFRIFILKADKKVTFDFPARQWSHEGV